MAEFIIVPEEIEPLAGVVDGYTHIEHEVSAQPTQYPVESGFIASDHAVSQPRRVKMTGWASDLTNGRKKQCSEGLACYHRPVRRTLISPASHSDDGIRFDAHRKSQGPGGCVSWASFAIRNRALGNPGCQCVRYRRHYYADIGSSV